MHEAGSRHGRWGVGLVAWTVCVVAAQAVGADPPLRAYLRTFRRHLDLAERDVLHVARLADASADRFIKEGRLYSCYTQPSFVHELVGRAGGLTSFGWWPRSRPADQVAMLMAIDSASDPPAKRAEWVNKAARLTGARVVVFANPHDLGTVTNATAKRPFQPSDFYGFIDNHVPEGEFTFHMPGADGPVTRHARLASVVNLVNGWAFVGELAAACTRRGKMPNFWLSFDMDAPRGYVRAKRHAVSTKTHLRQVPFHPKHHVPPVPAGVIGTRYIAYLRACVDRLAQWPALDEAVGRITAKLREGKKVYVFSVGHSFPHVVPLAERDGPLTVISKSHSQMEKTGSGGQAGDLLLLLCMPTYTEEFVTAALETGMDVIAVSGSPPPLAHRGNKHLYWIAVPWPMGDGCVHIPGYDIAILPVTGVMNAVIYYAVRSQVTHDLSRPAR